MKIGFIGAGMVGQMHLSHWSRIPECEIVALADLRPKLREAVASKFQIPLTYSLHTELVENPSIEAVVVVTRRHNTAAVVHDCLAAGKHVFSEKPMAMTLEQASMLSDVARTKGLHYSVGYQRRHDAGTQIGHKLFSEVLRRNELGAISHVRSWSFPGKDRDLSDEFLMTDEERPSGLQWKQSPEWIPQHLQSNYDRFINVFCHDINMLRYFLNKSPEIKYANLDHSKGQIAVFDFGQFPAIFAGALNEINNKDEIGKWNEGLEVHFENGKILIEFSPPLMHSFCSRVVITRGNEPDKVLCDGTGHTAAFELQASNFVAGVLNGQESLTSGKDAVEDLAIVESIWQMYLNSKAQAALTMV